jgi:hypothetical protein
MLARQCEIMPVLWILTKLLRHPLLTRLSLAFHTLRMTEIAIYKTGARPWMLVVGTLAFAVFMISILYWPDIRNHQYDGEGLPMVLGLTVFVATSLGLSYRDLYWNVDKQELYFTYPLAPFFTNRRIALGKPVKVEARKNNKTRASFQWEVQLLGRRRLVIRMLNESTAQALKEKIKTLVSQSSDAVVPASTKEPGPELTDLLIGLIAFVPCFVLFHLKTDIQIIILRNFADPKLHFLLLGVSYLLYAIGSCFMYGGTVKASAVLRSMTDRHGADLTFFKVGGWRLIGGFGVVVCGAVLQGVAKGHF